VSPGSAWSGFGVQDDIRAGELRGRRAAGGLAGGQEAAPLKVVGSGQAGLACTNDHHIRGLEPRLQRLSRAGTCRLVTGDFPRLS